MIISDYLGYNPLQRPSPYKNQLFQSHPNARWIEPSTDTEGLGSIYFGYGIFNAADTKRNTIVVFFANTNTLEYEDVSASYAAIGYNRNATPL
tara:strand:+ start:935 stop:1213 length:279 start_codon:yes stop_codon:yes gene_type:complete